MARTSLYRIALAAGLLTASASLAVAQTLTIGARGGPDSIDPHFTATGTHAETLKHVFDTLVWSGDGLEIEPRLAESWKAIDPTTWEFKLRRGVKFHDGSDFTAEDVKFSIARMATPMGPNPTTIYVRRVKETKVVDPHTLQNQCAKNLASGKRYLVKSSSPRKNRRPSSGTKRFVAWPVPRVLRHRLQWQWVAPLGVAVISNSMPPHKQLPWTFFMRESLRHPARACRKPSVRSTRSQDFQKFHQVLLLLRCQRLGEEATLFGR